MPTFFMQAQNHKKFTQKKPILTEHLLYSEKKDNYLQNIGYIGEQLDLYLVSKNIGTLWFGIGKVKEKQLDAGFAYDGDADRCLAVDGDGNIYAVDYQRVKNHIMSDTGVITQ